MDWLKSEIDSKKRQLDSVSSATPQDGAEPAPKYIKRGDLERQRVKERQEEEEREKKEREARLLAAAHKVAKKEQASGQTLSLAVVEPSSRESTSPAPTADPTLAVESTSKPETFTLSPAETTARLRRKGQPIRLFGESDHQRRLRLRALELIEERSEGQRNDFMRKMEGMEMGFRMEEVARQGGSAGGAAEKRDKEGVTKGKGKAVNGGDEGPAPAPEEKDGGDKEKKEPNPKDEEVLVDVSLVRTNPHKVYPQIYHALKRVLKEWEQSLADRPESVRRSTQGKIASATQQTSAEYLKPLFKSLRKRDLAPDLLLGLAEITFCMQTREYLKANDAYLRLSIGNAPWPIGVTMVGIHERSGREKIFSNNVAHVLNDETSRKYIQSLKRLLTFAQTVRPPADLSQLMG